MSKNLKTLICCILALIFVAGTVVAVFADSVAPVAESETASDAEVVTDEDVSEEPVVLKLGDVNFDGVITAADARLALRISAKLDIPTAEQLIVADVIADGAITAADARLILRVSALLDDEAVFGTITEEPASEAA